MPDYLFAYGTLQPGLAPGAIRLEANRLILVGRGFVAGRLYDLGDYPGAVFGGDGTVYGRAYELPNDPAVLDRFDWYEGVPDLYVRRAVTVAMGGGRQLTCWAYEYNQDVAAGRPISSGVYVPEHRP